MKDFSKIFFSVAIFSQFLIGNLVEAAEIINKNQAGYWVVDGFEIKIDIKCEISRSNFIPEKYCSNPAIFIGKSYGEKSDFHMPETSYFKLEVENIVLGDKWIFYGKNDPQRKISYAEMAAGSRPVRSEDLFKTLISKDKLKIKFMTKTGQDSPIKSKFIILSDFKNYATEQVEWINQQYDEKEKEEKQNLFLGLILLVSLLAITIILLKIFLRKARAKLVNLFKSKKIIEQEKRANLFYRNCKNEIQKYIDDHPDPNREDILKIAVNAKLMYSLFVNVKHLQSEAREFVEPLTTNGLAVFILIDEMEEYSALEKMQNLIKENYNQLIEKNTSELSLPAIDGAFAMSKLVNFDETLDI